MRQDTTTHSTAQAPGAGGAAVMADITTAAWQRWYALNADTMGLLLRQGTRMAQQAMQGGREGLGEAGHAPNPYAMFLPVTDPDGTLRTPEMHANTMAELFRYSASMLEIWQNAGIAIANLAAAQLQGRPDDLELLSRSAHEDAIDATESAMAATGTAITRGLGAMTRMTELAARAAAAAQARAAPSAQAHEPAQEEPSERESAVRRRSRAAAVNTGRGRHH